MNVKDVMTQKCECIAPSASLQEAAKKMKELDCGFLPIGDADRGRLEGVITDRDIVMRAVAQGCSPAESTVIQFATNKVLYCFEHDSIKRAVASMREQKVYRLIVLDKPESKRLTGIISLGDILRHAEQGLASEAAAGITARVA